MIRIVNHLTSAKWVRIHDSELGDAALVQSEEPSGHTPLTNSLFRLLDPILCPFRKIPSLRPKKTMTPNPGTVKIARTSATCVVLASASNAPSQVT